MLKKLFKLNRTLIGDGYDEALQLIKKELPEMKIMEFPTGGEYGTWKIPDKWVLNGSSLKHKEKEIPFQPVVGSLPFKGTISFKKLREHLYYDINNQEVTPYITKYYDKGWGFAASFKDIDKMKKGQYKVNIDTEYQDGTMKIGEYVIKGGKKEVLIMVHLDHPYQANDNLSGVIVAIDLAKTLKSKYTIRIVFVPETIGSVVYSLTQDLKNIEFGITLDMVGNDNTILMQKTFLEWEKINKAGITAMGNITQGNYRIAPFRAPLGADEYTLNDPTIGIPTIFFSRYPYPEYHTNLDTLDIIQEDKLKETAEVIKKTIKIMEEDYVPVRMFKAPLMRSRFGIQQLSVEKNRKFDYFIFLMDGEKSLLDLAFACQLDFEEMRDILNKVKKDGFIKSL